MGLEGPGLSPGREPRGSKPPGNSRKKHFSRVVDTLETSLEHFVSLLYSVEKVSIECFIPIP